MFLWMLNLVLKRRVTNRFCNVYIVITERKHFLTQVAEAEHLSAMEVELRRLEDMADSIVRDFGMMKKREELHRDTNGSSKSLVLSLCYR